MQEEIAKAEHLTPYNATFGDVFQDFYSAFDDTELRLAPNANPVPDPNAKMCFKEVDVYGKCPQLMQRPVPKPRPGSTVCTTYVTGQGDGYTKQFGDVPYFGGFSPLVPSSALEPMKFGNRPTDSALQVVKSGDIHLQNGDLKLRLRESAGMAIDSIQFKKTELLAKKPAFMFTTAGFNNSKGRSELANRADEAGLLARGGTASKTMRKLASRNAAFTKVQAAYAARPGTVIDGKPVRHSVLSPYVVTKRVTVTQNNTVRYTAGVTTPTPFRNARLTIPRLGLRSGFRSVMVLVGNAWKKAPAKATRFSTTKYAAVIVTNGKYAVGLRVTDAPKPKTFGTSFAHGTSYRVVRGSQHTLVSVNKTLGSLSPKTKTLAPAGTYSVTTDFTFGSLQVVKRALTKRFSRKPAKVCGSTAFVHGKVIKATKDGYKVAYTIANEPSTVIVKKPGHSLKPGDVIRVHVTPSTGKVVKVQRVVRHPGKPGRPGGAWKPRPGAWKPRPGKPGRKPVRKPGRTRPGKSGVVGKPVGKYITGVVTAYDQSSDTYTISYVFGNKRTYLLAKNAAKRAGLGDGKKDIGAHVSLRVNARGRVVRVLAFIKTPAGHAGATKKDTARSKGSIVKGTVSSFQKPHGVGSSGTFVISYVFDDKKMAYEYVMTVTPAGMKKTTKLGFDASKPEKIIGTKVVLHLDAKGGVVDIEPAKPHAKPAKPYAKPAKPHAKPAKPHVNANVKKV